MIVYPLECIWLDHSVDLNFKRITKRNKSLFFHSLEKKGENNLFRNIVAQKPKFVKENYRRYQQHAKTESREAKTMPYELNKSIL